MPKGKVMYVWSTIELEMEQGGSEKFSENRDGVARSFKLKCIGRWIGLGGRHGVRKNEHIFGYGP